MIRSPNADLGRDPRWGRTEECYGEDAYFNGAMVVAFVKGLQGDHPKYWLSAALMKHFLANSNENGRDNTSSNFDETCLANTTLFLFAWVFSKVARGLSWLLTTLINGVPMTVNPVWKMSRARNGDRTELFVLMRARWHERCEVRTSLRRILEHAAASTIKAGIGQFLDNYRAATLKRSKRGILTETDIDQALRGNFRVMIRLGLASIRRARSLFHIGTGSQKIHG